MRRARCSQNAAIALVVCCLAGCGEPGEVGGRLAITGTVKYKGEPIPSGSIEFIPHPGVNTNGGASITNGRYKIPAEKGLEPGMYTVKISWADPPAVTDEPGGLPGKDPVEKLPEKYNSKSTLTEEVTKEKRTIDFNLD
jgi:hypothetical protein